MEHDTFVTNLPRVSGTLRMVMMASASMRAILSPHLPRTPLTNQSSFHALKPYRPCSSTRRSRKWRASKATPATLSCVTRPRW